MSDDSYNGNEVEEVNIKQEETPVKVDKRKQSSKNNMEKARLAKIEQLKQKRLLQEQQNIYEINEEASSDSSDDSEVEYVLQKINKQKKKTKPAAVDNSNDRIQQLENMLLALAGGMKKQKKQKKVKNKTIIHLPSNNIQQPQQTIKEAPKTKPIEAVKKPNGFNFDW